MVPFGLKLMLQIIFQTMFLFMILWMTLFHDRWQNVRNFLKGNYSAASDIYFSGFIILLALVITTLGRGLNRKI